MSAGMVHHDIGRFLLDSDDGAVMTTPVDATTDKALVYIETRDTLWNLPVIASAVRTHPGWALYVFGTQTVIDRVHTRFPTAFGVRIDPIYQISQYNQLLYSREFWDFFPQSWVLVFQSDTVLVRGCRPEHFAYDYLGAVCGAKEDDPETFTMNGGLSLRRVSAMRRAVLLLQAHERSLPEDVGFTRVLRRHEFVVPAMEACHEFAIETDGHPRRAIGLHGTDKYYAPPHLIRALLDP